MASVVGQVKSGLAGVGKALTVDAAKGVGEVGVKTAAQTVEGLTGMRLQGSEAVEGGEVEEERTRREGREAEARQRLAQLRGSLEELRQRRAQERLEKERVQQMQVEQKRVEEEREEGKPKGVKALILAAKRRGGTGELARQRH